MTIMTILQLAEVRMRLFDAAHAGELTQLENLTGLPRGTLAHAMMAIPQADDAAYTVFDLWMDWVTKVQPATDEYTNFAVYVRKAVEAGK